MAERLSRRDAFFPAPEVDSGLPLVLELRPAPEPEEAFLGLADLPGVIFLDSAAPHPDRGTYSYLAALPVEWIEARGRRIRRRFLRGGAAAQPPFELDGEEVFEADPFRALAERLQGYRAAKVRGLPPFQGGAAGLFGYGLGRVIERLPPPRWDEFELPDLAAGIYDWVIAFDFKTGRAFFVAHGHPGRTREERLRNAEAAAKFVTARLAEPKRMRRRGGPAAPPLPKERLCPSRPVAAFPGLESDFSRSEYIEAVTRAIEYIHAGDVFQVNLSQRFVLPQRYEPVELYLRLRRANPAPFAGYFDLGSFAIASSSPEQFLALLDREVVTRPIKGTRPRGYTPEEDSFRALELLESAKDRSENVMIVDLLRNDISRVALPHSVRVPRLFELERHPTVHHLVSEVRARLRPEHGALDLLRAAFPGGSVTGAPKVRAMEIIAELEPTARGPYCGSLGWISFAGDMGTNILIRTVVCGRGWCTFSAGGGIVADSKPEAEYRETLDKALGMARAAL